MLERLVYENAAFLHAISAGWQKTCVLLNRASPATTRAIRTELCLSNRLLVVFPLQ